MLYVGGTAVEGWKTLERILIFDVSAFNPRSSPSPGCSATSDYLLLRFLWNLVAAPFSFPRGSSTPLERIRPLPSQPSQSFFSLFSLLLLTSSR